MSAQPQELARCPFCGRKVYVTRGITSAPFLFFKCNNAKCGAIVSFDNDVCNDEPVAAFICWERREGMKHEH